MLCIFPSVTLNLDEQKKLCFPLSLHGETFEANICVKSVAYSDYRGSGWGY